MGLDRTKRAGGGRTGNGEEKKNGKCLGRDGRFVVWKKLEGSVRLRSPKGRPGAGKEDFPIKMGPGEEAMSAEIPQREIAGEGSFT